MNAFPNSYPFSNELGLVFYKRYLDLFLLKIYKNFKIRDINLELAQLVLWAMTVSDSLDRFEKLVYLMVRILLKRSQIQRKEDIKKFINIELVSGLSYIHNEFEKVELDFDLENAVGKSLPKLVELDRRRKWELVQKLKEKFNGDR
ncbi:MAG: hypothetical protein C0446_08440 [Chitinophaga sp.]|nr:hypothetical protein [Chitinophaga sp.]